MTIRDAETGRVVGYVSMMASPYWSEQYSAHDANGEMYRRLTQIVSPTFEGARRELMAYDLEWVGDK